MEPEQGVLVESVYKSVKVAIEYDGEGVNGDYDPNDPQDYPHARYTVYQRHDSQDNSWVKVKDASHCTPIDANTDRRELSALSDQLLNIFYYSILRGEDVEMVCRYMSWLKKD